MQAKKEAQAKQEPEEAVHVKAIPLTKEAFCLYGSVIEKAGSENFLINNGNCTRHHRLATCEALGEGGEVGISLFSARPYSLPLAVNMVERHPLGSQAFYPLNVKSWLVIVCDNEDGVPIRPVAFQPSPGQGINLNPGVWHGVLTPLESVSDFLVVDRVGEGDNLEEFFFEQPFIVSL